MRFLKDANFDLDEKGRAALAARISDFLRVGRFSLGEWDSLTPVEQETAVQVQRTLSLEEALMLREAFRAETPEAARNLLQAAGDDRVLSHLVLEEAVRDLQNSPTMAEGLR